MQKDCLLFRIACAAFGVSSLSILLSFLGNYKGSGAEIFFAVLTGVLFWGGLLLGIALLVVINNHRKKSRSDRKYRRRKNLRFGALAFFSNNIAAIFDIAMVALFIMFVLSMFIPVIGQGITLALFSFFLFSVYMHSIFNGVNFIYIKSINEECRE